ncbi:GntR family transcriptional regulator [Staphylococcus kloosii]|nr:GntR family transcriptional regulator [Staphylococcus kloosii]MCD8879425.1 GntR family transcriptional regulator [Staphylococcus kloosii]
MDKPKYQIVADEIKEKIINKNYHIGMLLPTEKQFQDRYNLSRYTIRQAMDLLVSEGYIKKKKGSGSFVSNKYLSSNQDKSLKKIGVIVTYLSEYIFPNIIRGIEKELKKQGYSLILASTNNNHEDEKQCLEMMLNQGVSGLIVEPTKSNVYNPNLSYYPLFKQRDIPILMINANYEELNLPYIAIDDVKSGYLATQYLIDQGHEKIALITKIDDNQGKLRMKGYFNAFEQNDKLFNGEYIYTYNTESRQKVIEQIVEHISNRNISVSALVCYNDEIAYDIIHQMRQCNVNIPQDISIVGEDNSILSRLKELNLTTTAHPQELLGTKAANLIIEAIEQEKVLKSELIDTYIIERSSVKDLKNI